MHVLRNASTAILAVVLGLSSAIVATASGVASATTTNTWTTCVTVTGQLANPVGAQVCGSTLELAMSHMPANEAVEVQTSGGSTVATGTTDASGSLIVRNLDAGQYLVHDAGSFGFDDTDLVTVMPAEGSPTVNGTTPASAHLYDSQVLKAGLNYITTRDGTKLAATVRLPFGQKTITGKLPTIIEYSGYNTAAPKSLTDAILCPVLKNCGNYAHMGDPLLPSTSTVLGAVVGPVMGFAVVSVQMRGSACSGGAFDLFGYPSDYDGYDVVETVAAQSWVKGHKVGMVGISYSGISQLEVAGTQPPHLAAITPLSPTDDLFSTGYPGGIYNDGFAKGWIQERIHDAQPTVVADGADLKVKATATSAATYSGGQGWTAAEIAAEMGASWKAGTGGSSTCLANQALHAQSQDLASLVGPSLQRDPSLFDRRSPTVWASNINIPTYLVGSLQDEQTGPQWTNLIGAFPESNKDVYVTMDNGTHIDSVGPLTLSRWLEFLQIFVGGKAPSGPGVLGGIFAGLFIPTLISGNAANATALPDPRFTKAGTAKAAATAFRAGTPHVRILLDNGGGAKVPGSMDPTGEIDSASWPLADAKSSTASWAFYADGSMGDPADCSGANAPARCSNTTPDMSFSPNPKTGSDKISLPGTSSTSCTTGAFDVQPCYHWTQVANGDGLKFISDPLASDLVIAGDAAVKLQVASTTTDADLQATVSEVRSEKLKVDGGAKSKVATEEYVASGFLRASARKLKDSSTPLAPRPTYLSSDQQLLTPGTPVSVSIPMGTIAHLFRKGTRILITISAPGGDRPSWTFDTPANGGSDRTSISGLGDVASASFSFRIVKKLATSLRVPVGKKDDAKSSLQYTSPSCSALKDTRYLYGSLRGEPCRLYVPQVL